MDQRKMWQRISAAAAAGMMATCFASAPATAAEEEAAEEGPNAGALTITFDNSFTTAYIFRGILNVRDGLIWQPALDLGLNLYGSEEGIVRSVNLGVGMWNSVQENDVPGIPGSDGRYETDYYPSLSVEWAGGVTSAITYYFYTSPNGSFGTIEELDVDLSYDDSELLGAFAVHPTANFAFETHNTSYGSGKGSVVVLGIEPGTDVTLPFDEAGKYPLGITVPVNLGLSMDDYYNDGTQSDVFGYASIGLHASIPVACIPKKFGAWSITNGFDVYFLDDALEATNKNDAVYPVWTSSLTLDY